MTRARSSTYQRQGRRGMQHRLIGRTEGRRQRREGTGVRAHWRTGLEQTDFTDKTATGGQAEKAVVWMIASS